MTTPTPHDHPAPIQPGEFARDPFACLAKHRAAGWWAPIAGMDLVEVLDYEAVRELLGRDGELVAHDGAYFDGVRARNPEIVPALIERSRERNARTLINMDGDEHRRLRSLVARAFTPRSVAALAPAIEAQAEALCASLQPGDDFMAGFARQLPARSLCALTGIPDADRQRFIAWIDLLEAQASPEALLRMSRSESEQLLAAQLEFDAYCLGLIRGRRSHPQDDLVSRLVREAEGEFDDGILAGVIGDLIFAGNNPMRNGLGLMVMTLADLPEVWERTASEPEFAGRVVEELLRLESPAPGPVRRAACPVAHRGHTFAEGAVLALSIWSSNRDERLWGETADRFDAEREHSGEHLSFGHGAHYCLGASLAREELRAALVVLTHRLTRLRLVAPPEMHLPGGIYGPRRLLVEFERR